MKITQDEWDRLPWLLSRKTVLQFTGLTEPLLRKLEAAGTIHRCLTSTGKGRGKKRGKFFKTELAKFCKIDQAA